MLDFCKTPFNNLHVRTNNYTTCCNGWFTDPSKIIVYKDGINSKEEVWNIWNHDKFQNLRKHWLESNSSLCKFCPLLVEKFAKQPSRLSDMDVFMKRGPRNIFFANDLTCQLHCWSCRAKPIIEKQQERIFNQTFNILEAFKEDIKFISAIGSGDPFASPSWLKILQTLPIEDYLDLNIEIFTNGILLPRYWDSLSHIHDNIKTIKMSVDAGTKEVYERTRLGGKFEDMDNAMKFISQLNKKYVVNMVIQSDNFVDIPIFLERAIKYNATKVNLTLLHYWPQMAGGRKVYDAKSLANPNHPKRKEFLKLLKDNEDLINNKIVHSSKMSLEYLDMTYTKHKGK